MNEIDYEYTFAVYYPQDSDIDYATVRVIAYDEKQAEEALREELVKLVPDIYKRMYYVIALIDSPKRRFKPSIKLWAEMERVDCT